MHERPFRHLMREIKRWNLKAAPDGTKGIVADRMSVNGLNYDVSLTYPSSTRATASARMVSPQRLSTQADSGCPDTCGPNGGTRPTTTCIRYDWQCLLGKYGFCGFGVPVGCTALGPATEWTSCVLALLACATALDGCCTTACHYCMQCGVGVG